jgi:hypothetical protein
MGEVLLPDSTARVAIAIEVITLSSLKLAVSKSTR